MACTTPQRRRSPVRAWWSAAMAGPANLARLAFAPGRREGLTDLRATPVAVCRESAGLWDSLASPARPPDRLAASYRRVAGYPVAALSHRTESSPGRRPATRRWPARTRPASSSDVDESALFRSQRPLLGASCIE